MNNDSVNDSVSIGLKEWHLVISALLDGRQAILLRKGGILEANNEFELEHRRFALFPTFIHQDPAGVKPEYRGQIVAAKSEPELVHIAGWAEVETILEVPDRGRMELLDDLHLWDKPLLDMRFNYRPEKPLYLVVVRAYRLAEVVTIPNTLEYAGCKSWVPLGREISVAKSVPALSEVQVGDLLARIESAFGAT